MYSFRLFSDSVDWPLENTFHNLEQRSVEHGEYKTNHVHWLEASLFTNVGLAYLINKEQYRTVPR